MNCIEQERRFEELPQPIKPFIIYLDPLWKVERSLGGAVRLYLEAALEVALGEAYHEKKEELYEEGFILTEHSLPDFQAGIPKQDNAFDCGLFVLEYIESLWLDHRGFLEQLLMNYSYINWFPQLLISNKRMLLVNIIMHLVNGESHGNAVKEYLDLKKLLHARAKGEGREAERKHEDVSDADSTEVDKASNSTRNRLRKLVKRRQEEKAKILKRQLIEVGEGHRIQTKNVFSTKKTIEVDDYLAIKESPLENAQKAKTSRHPSMINFVNQQNEAKGFQSKIQKYAKYTKLLDDRAAGASWEEIDKAHIRVYEHGIIHVGDWDIGESLNKRNTSTSLAKLISKSSAKSRTKTVEEAAEGLYGNWEPTFGLDIDE